jgi:acetate kinase
MKANYLIINIGSTSIKTGLYSDALKLTAEINAQYSATTSLALNGKDLNGQSLDLQYVDIHDASAALQVIVGRWQQWLTDAGFTLTAIGHRIVHGGERFAEITLLDEKVLEEIEQLDSYAPLHNPLNRLGVAILGQTFTATPQFAVFDTAFHRQIPECAGRYAIPTGLSNQINFYRYGFHGISCQHSLMAAANYLDCNAKKLNLIILHLGGGASATAVKAGISIDTSMGFSPTEGLVMSSRSGDIDPMIAITLLRQGMTVDQLDKLLNKQSGLAGICGQTDMRTISKSAEQGDQQAQLAIELFCYRIKKYIGGYCAVLGQVDALVFTGGIGEHAPEIRQTILQGLEQLGFVLDKQANQSTYSQVTEISVTGSRAKILVIPAEEDREIANQIHHFLTTKTR